MSLQRLSARRFTRRACGFALASVVCLACSDDPESNANQGGAGAAGLGGVAAPMAGVGGSAGTPPIGTAGTTGSAGSAGVAAAGAGGAGASGVGGAGGVAGGAGTGGVAGSAGMSGVGGSAGAAGSAGSAATDLEPFSFFVTSLEAMRRLSGVEVGFGGDLTYGEADGLSGADKICTEIAEYSMPGSGAKGWHAFLSVAGGPDGRVDAIDRVGDGPWYDRLGRLVAMDTDALANERPMGADPAIAEDLPNEYGVPNSRPDPNQPEEDNHHMLTGSGADGRLYMGSVNGTCANWTSTEASADGRPRIGFAFSAGGRVNWISGQDEGGCGAGYDVDGGAGSDPSNPIVGSGGGYGGIYCFALMP